MATDFDFDGSFNEDPDDEVAAEEEAEEEAESGGRSRLRTILLLLFVLVLVCVACFVLPSRLGLNLPASIPIIGSNPPPPTQVAEEPAQPDEEAPPLEEETVGEESTNEETTGESPAPNEESVEGGEETEGTVPEDTTEGEETEQPPTEENLVGEHDQEAVETEPQPEGTTEAEPEETTETEPESDQEPMEGTPLANCENNNPPTAQIELDRNPAMIGKGEAVVAVDASGSTDDGMIVEYAWNFGDGSDDVTGEDLVKTTHGYKTEGTYIITLTVLDDCETTGSTTAEVTVVGPTPPAENGDNNGDDNDGSSDDDQGSTDPAPDATAEPPSNVTLGSCYIVQRGDTLTGIAWHFGIPLPDLARVNNVTTKYFVLAGQGLFIPTGTIQPGPNGYQVQAGDTLNSIAWQCGLTVGHLAQVNGLNTNATLTAGQVIIVPIGYR